MSGPDPAAGSGPALSRRTVLMLGLVGVIGATVGSGATMVIARLGRSTQPRYRFFTEAEAGLLVDICEQIIPGDDVSGATDTGAICYIDRQLCGALARHRRAYRRGLESFRQTCLQSYGARFQDLASSAKIEALRSVERGEVPKALWSEPSAKAFFNLVVAHTMQSFYGSPRHGGNRNYASFRMLGLDYPQVVGQNRYRKA